ELGIEGVAVIDGLDVAARARISVPVPGATDIGALFERDCREARLAQPMQQIESGETGADDRDVDLLRGSALRGVRSACCNCCVWHAIPPVCFDLTEG